MSISQAFGACIYIRLFVCLLIYHCFLGRRGGYSCRISSQMLRRASGALSSMVIDEASNSIFEVTTCIVAAVRTMAR